MLIENGADVGAKANNGLTAMHLCAQEDRVPVAEVLHTHGADVNAKTKAGYSKKKKKSILFLEEYSNFKFSRRKKW